jgi:hypothetical protein
MLGCAAFLIADISEQRIASIIPIMEEIRSPKRPFLQEPHGVTSQNRASFIVTAVQTSNLNIAITGWAL